MNLGELLKKRMVEKTEADQKAADGLLNAAESNLVAAEDNLGTNHPDWALAIAYNAMLSAGRALMFFKGYRPKGDSQHLATVHFCSAVMPSDSSELINSFNRYRSRRHDVVYGEAEKVGNDEAKRAITNAKRFVEKIRELCRH